jgi:hypothetical protein
MTFLRLWALGLVLVLGVILAGCSGMGCRSDSLPLYPDPGKPVGEPPRGVPE